MTTLSPVRFAGVQALKSDSPNSATLKITGDDLNAVDGITNLPRTDDAAFLSFNLINQDTFGKASVTIDKEDYNPHPWADQTYTNYSDTASAADLGVILSLSQKAVDAPEAPGVVNNTIKPLLTRLLGARTDESQQAESAIKAAQTKFQETVLGLSIFAPFKQWLGQA